MWGWFKRRRPTAVEMLELEVIELQQRNEYIYQRLELLAAVVSVQSATLEKLTGLNTETPPTQH